METTTAGTNGTSGSLEGLLPADPEEREQLRRKWADLGKRDLYFLCKSILGMRDLVDHYHKGMCQWISNSTAIRKHNEEPRGHLKSSICLVGHSMQLILNNPNIRLLWVSYSAEIVEDHLRTLKGHFENNRLFHWLYPEIVPDFRRVKRWTNSEIEVPREAGLAQPTIRAVGIGSKTTGSHYDWIKFDDVIGEELSREAMTKVIKDVVAMEKLLENPALNPIDYIGTRWTNYDLYGWLMENDPRLKIRIRAALEDEEGNPDLHGQPIWPERFSRDYLLSLYGGDSIQRYSFMSQYMNMPIVPEEQLFKPEWFEYYEELPKGLSYYIGVDLATEGGRDATAVVVVGIDSIGDWYVAEASEYVGLNPRERIDVILQAAGRYRPVSVGIERTRFEDLMFYFEEECRYRKVYPNVQQLNHSGRYVQRKTQRVAALQPLFEHGRVFLPSSRRCDGLQQQLEDYPGRRDDLPDAMANILEIADMSGYDSEQLPAYVPDCDLIGY